MSSWVFLELGCAGPVRGGGGVGNLAARNSMPWGWPALFRPEEIVDVPPEAGDPPSDDHRLVRFLVVAPVPAVRARALALGGGDPRFDAFGELAARLSDVAGWAVMDPTELPGMREPGELRDDFARACGAFQAGVRDFGDWRETLRGDAGDATRARRVTSLGTARAALSRLALGTPGGPWEHAWQPYLDGGPAAPPLRAVTDEAEQLLADVEQAGLVRVLEGTLGHSRRTRREQAVELLTVAARFRSAFQLGQILGMSVALGHLEALRVVGWTPFALIIGRGDPSREIAVFDQAVLTAAIDRLGE